MKPIIKFRYPINKKVEDILNWLESEMYTIPSEDYKGCRIHYYAELIPDGIQVEYRMYDIHTKEFLGGDIQFSFVVREFDNSTSIIVGKFYTHDIGVEKLAYSYLLNLGTVVNADWKTEVIDTLKKLEETIQKEGGHYGQVLFEIPPLDTTYREFVDWLERYPNIILDKQGETIHIKHENWIAYPQEMDNGDRGTIINITNTENGFIITGHHYYNTEIQNGQPLQSKWLETFIKNAQLYFGNKNENPEQDNKGKPTIPSTRIPAGKYDDLCRDWVSRPYIPKQNKDEFLSEHASELNKKAFDRILEDAYKRGIIDKVKGRYKPKAVS
ncbi:MAG: hypothetical protein JNJ43_08385 [Anaerolineales bacterium]|nr:hypothetical protein [Anaerolineales bacterium]